VTAKPPLTRITQAVALLAGALVLVIVIHPDAARFFWTPLVLGLSYLAAATAGGRRGGHWATACALTGWGAAVAVAGAARPDLDIAGLYLAGAGLGALAGLLLARAGFAVEPLGLAGAIAVAGLVLALTTQAPDLLGDARTYAAALATVALANLALAARDLLAGRRDHRVTPPSTDTTIRRTAG